jgi:hypothetical protein
MTIDHTDWSQKSLAAGNTTMLKKRFLIGATALLLALILVGMFGGSSAHAQAVSPPKVVQETCKPNQAAVWLQDASDSICVSPGQSRFFPHLVKIQTGVDAVARLRWNQGEEIIRPNQTMTFDQPGVDALVEVFSEAHVACDTSSRLQVCKGRKRCDRRALFLLGASLSGVSPLSQQHHCRMP